MESKRKTSRIVFKYIEAPRPIPTDESRPQPPRDSLAHRAWVNSYQARTVRFDLPTSTSAASKSPASSMPSSQPTSTPCSPSAASPISSPGRAITTKALPSASKTYASCFPAIPAKASTEATNMITQQVASSPPFNGAFNQPLETLYTTTTTTITSKNGTIVKEHKLSSRHKLHLVKGATKWNGFRSPHCDYPQQKVGEKKVLASYSSGHAW